jgi:hypothetical protein
MKKSLLVVAGALALMALGGCVKYYQVTDPTTGKEYYTTKLDRKAGGAFAFKDERSGAQVTLQNSEVLPISEESFRTGKARPVEKGTTTTNTTHSSTTYTTPAPR